MPGIVYIELGAVDPVDFLPILNKPKIRKHLVEHSLFDAVSAKTWLDGKIIVDASPGCKLRAILVDERLAGWCGLQEEGGRYEIAIVLGDDYWGIGKRVFRDVMAWAKELGHETVFIHLLHTRRVSHYLKRMARAYYESDLSGDQFMTYELAVSPLSSGGKELKSSPIWERVLTSSDR